MSLLTAQIIALLEDPEAVKVVATTDEQGRPHAVRREGFTVLDDGSLAYAEGLESSQTNSNLLRALWYDRYVAVTVFGKEGAAFQIKGKPVRFDFTSPLYKRFYQAARESYGKDSDITGVWLIAPEEVRNEAFEVRKAEEERTHPYFRHLDRESIKRPLDS